MPQPTAFDQLIAEVEACVDRLLKGSPRCRQFVVIRHADASGNGPAKIIATGVVFPSGYTLMEYTTAPAMQESWPDAAQLLAAHNVGHREVVFRD